MILGKVTVLQYLSEEPDVFRRNVNFGLDRGPGSLNFPAIKHRSNRCYSCVSGNTGVKNERAWSTLPLFPGFGFKASNAIFSTPYKQSGKSSNDPGRAA